MDLLGLSHQDSYNCFSAPSLTHLSKFVSGSAAIHPVQIMLHQRNITTIASLGECFARVGPSGLRPETILKARPDRAYANDE